MAGDHDAALWATPLPRSPMERLHLQGTDYDKGINLGACVPIVPLLTRSLQRSAFRSPFPTKQVAPTSPLTTPSPPASQGGLLLPGSPQRDTPRAASASPEEVSAASPLMLRLESPQHDTPRTVSLSPAIAAALPLMRLDSSPAGGRGSPIVLVSPPRAASRGASLTSHPILAGKPQMKFYTPRGAFGAFALMRLGREIAASPPQPLLLGSPEPPSPGALLAAELLLDFAQQPHRSIGTPAPPRREGPEPLMLTPPHGGDYSLILSPTGSLEAGQPAIPDSAAGSPALTTSPVFRFGSTAAGGQLVLPEAAAAAARVSPLRSVVDAVKTPLRSALKKRPLPLNGNAPETPAGSRSTKRVRFLKALHNLTGSSKGSPPGSAKDRGRSRRGPSTSSWRPLPSLFRTPGRGADDTDPRSPLAGEVFLCPV